VVHDRPAIDAEASSDLGVSMLQTYFGCSASLAFVNCIVDHAPGCVDYLGGPVLRVVDLPFGLTETPICLPFGLKVLAPVRIPATDYLGEPVETWFGDGDTILLGCVCGDQDAGPLPRGVTITAAAAAWAQFRTGHRDRTSA